MSGAGRLIGVGVGPGDPELLTLKAVKVIGEADVIAFFAKAGNASNARRIVEAHLRPGIAELRLLYPVTTEIAKADPAYGKAIDGFFDTAAASVAARLDAGLTVAVLSEGDPFFYGSYMHLHVRLSRRYPTEVVAGVTSISGCTSVAGVPIAQGEDILTILPGTLSEAELSRRLGGTDAAVVIKLGRNLGKVRRALTRSGSLGRAIYVERGTMTGAAVVPLIDKPDDVAPYFAVVLVPGFGGIAVSGTLRVVGLGPGEPGGLTREAEAALDEADVLYGYGPYLARVAEKTGQRRHASDNREEGVRARAALDAATAGASVALVSGGDPGVFAMAAAVCEQIESGPESWRSLDVAVIPGVSAMLAVAARAGAPLGNDFCAISLSDNLKPWTVVERRLAAAAEAGFVIALYNPISRARPWQLGAAFAILSRVLPQTTPVVFGHGVGRAGERLVVASLEQAATEPADMASLIIVGSRETRIVSRAGRDPLVYTPRSVEEARR